MVTGLQSRTVEIVVIDNITAVLLSASLLLTLLTELKGGGGTLTGAAVGE